MNNGEEDQGRRDNRPIENRLNNIDSSLNAVREKVVGIEAETKFIQAQLQRMEHNTISVAEFLPVKLVVYGLAGTILLTVLASLLTLLLRTTGKL